MNPQKSRAGLSRLLHAGVYSLHGLAAAWREPAFRQEACAALVMLPAAFWLGQNWVQIALLTGSVILVMVVELLNTGIELCMDRVGTEWSDFSKRAKDMGSAAVMLSALWCAGVWLAAIWGRCVA